MKGVQRRLFSAPVDPKFIAAWRAYEDKYASPISGIFLSDLDLGSGSPVEKRSRADVLWENADDEAKEQAAALEGAIEFAFEQATDDWRDFGRRRFRESIEEGSSAWDRLKKETGPFDLRGCSEDAS